MSEISGHMTRGAAWMIALRLIVRSIGIVSMLVLARLLEPAAFGIVMVAAGMAALVQTLAQFDFELAVLRDRHADRGTYDTAWTLNILQSFAVGTLLALLAEPIAAFMGEPVLRPVLLVLAGLAALGGFENIGVVDFRKQFRFSRETAYMAIPKLLGAPVAIVVAVLAPGAWALIAGLATAQISRLGLSFVMSPFRPRPSLVAWRALFEFSRWLALHNVLYTARQQLDRLVLGRLLGPAGVGLFGMARELATLTTTEIVHPIRRGIFPALGQMDGARDRVAHAVLDVTGQALLLVTPAAVGLGLIAEPLVALALGEDWAPVATLLPILAIVAVLEAAAVAPETAFIALGRPRLSALCEGLTLAVALPAIAVGASQAGLTGAAWGLVAAAAVYAGVGLCLAGRMTGFDVAAIARRAWRPALGNAAMIATVVGAGGLLSQLGDAPRLMAVVGLGGTVYLVTVLAAWHLAGRPEGAESQVVVLALRRFRSRGAGAGSIP